MDDMVYVVLNDGETFSSVDGSFITNIDPETEPRFIGKKIITISELIECWKQVHGL